MIGPPGSGQSMIAKRVPSILPPISLEEAIETTKIHSICGQLNGDRQFVTTRPFRSPHHTISDAGLLGGSMHPTPGEVSLAHNGVLFLDELPEFHRSTLEVMRPVRGWQGYHFSRSRFTHFSGRVYVDRGDESLSVWSLRQCKKRVPM